MQPIVLKINQPIDHSTKALFKYDLGRLKPRDYYWLEISADGGKTKEAAEIIELINAPGTALCNTTIAGKNVKSAALYIFQMGLTRLAHPDTLFLLHRHYLSGESPSTDPSAMEMQFLQLLSKRSGQPVETLFAIANSNNGQGQILNARKALELNFVDFIVKGPMSHR